MKNSSKDPFVKALIHLMRTRRFASQVWIAQKARVSQQTISAILTGRSRGLQKTREKIATVFNLKYETMLTLGSKLLEEDNPNIEDSILEEFSTERPWFKAIEPFLPTLDSLSEEEATCLADVIKPFLRALGTQPGVEEAGRPKKATKK